jgi:hypothetical protein
VEESPPNQTQHQPRAPHHRARDFSEKNFGFHQRRMSRLFQQGSNSESPMCDATERGAEALIKDSPIYYEIKKFSDRHSSDQ